MLPLVPVIQSHDIAIRLTVPRQLDLHGIWTYTVTIIVIGPVLRHVDVERVQTELRVILMDVMVRCLVRLGDLSGTHVDVVVRMGVLLDGGLSHITGRRSHLNQRLNALILSQLEVGAICLLLTVDGYRLHGRWVSRQFRGPHACVRQIWDRLDHTRLIVPGSRVACDMILREVYVLG